MSALARMVQQVIEPQSVLEGAGVRLNRSIGTQRLSLTFAEYLCIELVVDCREHIEAVISG